MHDNTDAIVLQDVVKRFRKSTIRHEYTTFKSELLRWLRGGRERNLGETRLIEALRGVSLSVPRGRTIGILGRNGSGKSTLLKLITGIYRPTSGSIQVNGRVSALLDLGAGFHPDFSGRENILINGIILGMSRAQVRERMDEIIAFSELGDFIDEPVRTYSSGMYARLAFAVATHVDPEILIVDEILAVGDEHFGKKSMSKMMEFKKQGKTIVLVTHDLSTVERWCDMAVWIDAGRIRGVGSPMEVAREYRQAVSLAEQRSVALGPAALSADGGALPMVEQGAVPLSGPAPSPQHRWGSFEVEISDVRLLGPEGAPVDTVDTEDALDICIDFQNHQNLGDVCFGLSLFNAEGLKVYGTNTLIDGMELPSPLPASGTVRLRLERLGLTAGHYLLDVCAHTQSGREYDYHRGLHGFRVGSPIADSGVVRPPHRWTLEPVAAQQQEPPAQRAIS